MYWSDIRNGTLNRAFLNGANVEVLFHTDDPLIIDLAVDWVNEKIYWTEAIRSPGVKRIYVLVRCSPYLHANRLTDCGES
jgi:hypothetical protein